MMDRRLDHLRGCFAIAAAGDHKKLDRIGLARAIGGLAPGPSGSGPGHSIYRFYHEGKATKFEGHEGGEQHRVPSQRTDIAIRKFEVLIFAAQHWIVPGMTHYYCLGVSLFLPSW
jgi:hypothetical protein